MTAWLLKNRTRLGVALLVLLAVALPVGAQLHGEAFGRALYTWLLLLLCGMPVALMSAFNSRHVLLAIFMGTYFMHFGAVDLHSLLLGEEELPERSGFLTAGEIAVLVSGVLILAGYLAGVRIIGASGRASGSPREWPAATTLLTGTALWAAGTCAVVYFQVYVAPEKSNLSIGQGLAAMGPMLTFVVMLGQMVQPLGLLILAYGYARYRGPAWTALILAVVVVQVAVGFVVDIKGLALLPGVVVITVRMFVDRRPPVTWILVGLVFVVLAFPVFQAYRQVAGERGLNRLQTLHEIWNIVSLSVSNRERVETGRRGERAQTLVERGYVKDNLENVLQHVGSDLPFLGGTTLADMPYMFVPRFLNPDKVHVAIGQLYNHEIGKSELDTYISVSHISEWYWNFGWPGIVGGMLLTGLLLGMTGVGSSLEHGVTLTRVMVIMATVQQLCLGFEGEISNSYTVWLRSLAAIGLLHLAFARRGAGVQAGAAAAGAGPGAGRAGAAIEGEAAQGPASARPGAPRLVPAPLRLGMPPRHPNVMR